MSKHEAQGQSAAQPAPASPVRVTVDAEKTKSGQAESAGHDRRIAELRKTLEARREQKKGAKAAPAAPATKPMPLHEQIVATLKTWSERHPNPDFPAIGVATMGEFSPREISWEVERQSEAGRIFEFMIVNGAPLYANGIAGVLNSFAEESGDDVRTGTR